MFNGVDVMPESETVTDDTVRRVQGLRVMMLPTAGVCGGGENTQNQFDYITMELKSSSICRAGPNSLLSCD